MEGFRFISGVPILGTILACAAGVWGFGSVGTAGIGLFVMAIDTGGSVWFLLSTWKDTSLWDA